MRQIGLILIIAGVVWGVTAFNMETSIRVGGHDISYYSNLVPGIDVSNLDLIERRRNHLMGAGVTIISGILLFGFGVLKASMKEQGTAQPDSTKNIVHSTISYAFAAVILALVVFAFTKH